MAFVLRRLATVRGNRERRHPPADAPNASAGTRELPHDADEPIKSALRERIAGHWRLDDERWLSHQREHQILDHAAESASDIAAKALDAYKMQANEFRGSLADQRAEFVTRAEHGAFGSRIDALEDDRIARDAATKVEAATAADQRERDRRYQDRERFRLGVLVSIVSIVASAVVAIILHIAFP